MSNIMRFTRENGTITEYINMNEFTYIKCLSGKKMIILEKLTNDKPHVKIYGEVDEESICLL